MIDINKVRQQLQNCGRSLRASDFKLLLDYIEEIDNRGSNIEDDLDGNPEGLIMLKLLTDVLNMYNVTDSKPINGYYNLQTAIKAVPTSIRKEGLIITYEAYDGKWLSKQFIGDSKTQWGMPNHWSDYGTSTLPVPVSGDIIISNTEPEEKDALWIDTSDNQYNDQDNPVIMGLLETIANLQRRLDYMEYAFNNEINFGDFDNNITNTYIGKTNVRPDPYNIPAGIGNNEDFNEPYDYNQYLPNAKHLVIKSGTYEQMMANKDNFAEAELLWCHDTKNLWIKNPKTYELIKIGTSDDEPIIDPEDMEGILQETINSIKRIVGIEMVDMENKDLLYRIQVKGGKLELYDYSLDKTSLASNTQQLNQGKYYKGLYFPNLASEVGSSTSPKLYINSVYCGGEDSDAYSYNPVSHNFVELSNLGKKEINLKGLFLHYTCKNLGKWITLPLKGKIKPQGTFLIKGDQSSIIDVNTTYIKVEKPDMIWTKEHTLNSDVLTPNTWGNNNLIRFDTDCSFYISGAESEDYFKTNVLEETSPWSASGVIKWYIDLVGIGKYNGVDMTSEKLPVPISGKDILLFRYYNMDLVSQATKAATARNNFADWTYLNLNNLKVDIDITKLIPKSSTETKNVFFNKTLIQDGPPSVVTCTFGYNAHTTRCFNWISKGYYNEYIKIWKDGELEDSAQMYESFKDGDGRPNTKNWDSSIYNRIRTLSTDGTSFTVHKFIIDLPEANQKYYYKVGKEGAWSEEHSFTLRTRASVMESGFKFLQVTDQQGFTGNEYDMWGEVAKFIKDNEDFHFIINTGDIAQNGNRINEYLDYYHKGKDLIKDYEHMFCVGNNDLCPINPFDLGDGDGLSKTSPVYTEYFYTFEHPTEIPRSASGQYVASVYDWYYGDTYFLAMNSEVTSNAKELIYNDSSLYENLKTWCEARLLEIPTDIKWRTSYTHDNPLTLLTADLIMLNLKSDGAGGFIEDPNIKRGGSHLNTEGNYWYSKFLQDNNFKICWGGHKHTFTNTRPIREDGTLTMKPYVYSSTETPEWYNSLPAREKNLLRINTDSSLNYVKYVTCQASGYKLVSNKELPAKNIPWLESYYPVATQIEDAITNTVKVTVNKEQQFPHYIIWNIGKGTEDIDPSSTTASRDRIVGKVNKLKQTGNSEPWFYQWNTPITKDQLVKVGGNGDTNPDFNIIVEQIVK